MKEDIKCTPAELVFGKTTRLPGEFFHATPAPADEAEFANKLRKTMRELQPTPASNHSARAVFVHHDLNSCTHVFIRVDSVKPPLQPPYEGPHRILERNAKYFTIDVNGKRDTVSIDRLKPAYLPNEFQVTQEHSYALPPSHVSHREQTQNRSLQYLKISRSLGREYCGDLNIIQLTTLLSITSSECGNAAPRHAAEHHPRRRQLCAATEWMSR